MSSTEIPIITRLHIGNEIVPLAAGLAFCDNNAQYVAFVVVTKPSKNFQA
jgi:hypothetical protein